MFTSQPSHASDAINIDTLAWAHADLEKAVTLLAQRSGVPADDPLARRPVPTERDLTDWLPSLADQFGLEARQRPLTYRETLSFLWRCGPALLPLPVAGHIVLLRGGRWRCTILARDGSTRRIAPSVQRSALFSDVEDPYAATLTRRAGVIAPSGPRRAMIYRALQTEYLGHHRLSSAAWQLAPVPPDAVHALRQSGLLTLLGVHIGVRVLWYACFFVALALLGGSLGAGRVEWSLLSAGLLVWAGRVPLALASSWLERRLGLQMGLYFKAQLMRGTLNLQPDEVARAGSGPFLFWWLQSEAFAEAWLNRGHWFLSALVFIGIAVPVLLLIGDAISAALLAGWLLLALLATALLSRRYQQVDTAYAQMTSASLERLRGHTTRLVQERDWHTAADRELAAQSQAVRRQDTRLALAWVGIPYIGFILIVMGLAPDFVLNTSSLLATDPGVNLRFAVLLFGLDQLYYLAQALPDVARMRAAWVQTRTLRHTADQTSAIVPVPPADVERPLSQQPFLELQNVRFAHTPQGKPVLDSVQTIIYGDDNILLTGASGAGKSTLAQILAGLRNQRGGLVLLHGYDQATIGTAAWRQRILLVPQFYANQLFDGTLAFNLLMGRGWPPDADDLQEAETICRALGLGPLLDRMPHGLQQPIGAAGWRLSHGERNRVFIARALLQDAYLVILDESLTALDPDLTQVVAQAVRAHTGALLVISHETADAV